MKPKSVGVIGAGAWGSGLAQAIARGGHKVQIWALENDVVDSINNEHENKRYLPGFPLSENLTASTNIEEVANGKEYLILASPSLFIASTAKQISNVPSIKNGETVIGVLTKGFVSSAEGPRLILDTLEDVLPESYKGALVYISGPSHAEEVAMGKLTGLSAASELALNSIKCFVIAGDSPMSISSLIRNGLPICTTCLRTTSLRASTPSLSARTIRKL